MANAVPAQAAPKKKPEGAPAPKDSPVIEYYGEGADKVQFTVDPKAKRIRVYSGGMVLVDY